MSGPGLLLQPALQGHCRRLLYVSVRLRNLRAEMTHIVLQTPKEGLHITEQVAQLPVTQYPQTCRGLAVSSLVQLT